MKSNLACLGIILCVLSTTGCRNNQISSPQQFKNPGGMWIPHQLTNHTRTLKSLGVEKPQELTDPLGYPLGAIVWLGGCSASFVSPNGLIATNHHCATRTLQFVSTPEQNRFEQGFLAYSHQEELPAEVGKKVWISREIIDVSDTVRNGLEQIHDPLERHTEIENRIKKLIAQHERPEEGIRCEVKKYFEGQKYYMLKFLELKDIRLVYAPPECLGAYGGDIDNWHWPRHTADFTFYRAYVSPSGQPAEYSPDNVPYHPQHWLQIASESLNENDFVMVAGYPGRTHRWKTFDEISWTFEKYNPVRIEVLSEVAAIYKELALQSQGLEIKVAPSIKGVMNYLQKLELVQENIKNSDLLEQKANLNHQLKTYMNKQDTSDILNQINQLNTEYQRYDTRNYYLHCLTNYVHLIKAGHTIVRMAEERPRPDTERDPSFQKRNWDRMIQDLKRMQTGYDPVIDKAIAEYYLKKIMELPVVQLQELPKPLLNPDSTERLLGSGLTIDNPDIRVNLFKNASLDDLQKSGDPAIQFALRIRPLTKQIEDNDKIYSGRMALLRPQYVQALKDMNHNQPLAPDANGTLRVTYGTIKGYRPAPTKPLYTPFTTLAELLEKNTGTEPFDVPEAFIEAAAKKQTSPYYWPKINDVPVNFLSDIDITGGNSGSATLNRKGQWVGLVFDGNSEALSSDWLFDPEITRGIHVDIRYILWIMREVDHAHHLLDEMGID